MSKLSAAPMAILGLALIGALLAGCGMSFARPIPVVRLTLDQTFEEMQERSTYNFDLQELDAWHLLATQGPVNFVYKRGGSTTSFPPSRFLALNVIHDHVTSASLNPLLEPVALDAALNIAKSVMTTLHQTGWKDDASARPEVFDEARKIMAEPSENKTMNVVVGQMKLNGDWLQMSISRMWGTDDKFIVSIQIQNYDVISKYTGHGFPLKGKIKLHPVTPAIE